MYHQLFILLFFGTYEFLLQCINHSYYLFLQLIIMVLKLYIALTRLDSFSILPNPVLGQLVFLAY